MDTHIEDLASGSLADLLTKAQGAGAVVKLDFGERPDAVTASYSDRPPQGYTWAQSKMTVDAACQALLLNLPA